MNSQVVDLDHNATTPIHPEVVQAMCDVFGSRLGNAASSHRKGRQARRVLEDARNAVAQLLGADIRSSQGDRLVFTSGGTEANNLALRGMAGPPGSRILISSIEHPSVKEPADALQQAGYDVQPLDVSSDGVVDLGDLQRKLNSSTRLISVMLANNETGVVQPVEEIVQIGREAGVAVHTDAVQAIGKRPVDFRQLGVTAMTLSAHKFHGPRGIGALVIRGSASLKPILYGGFHQHRLRPGTEPIELVIGLLTALQLWQESADQRVARMTALRDEFEQHICGALPTAVVNGSRAVRLPHTSNVAFPGIDCQALHMALDMAGVACSVGSACASGSAEPSPVLIAMHLPPTIVHSALRFSLGALTTRDEIRSAVDRIVTCVKRLSGRMTDDGRRMTGAG